MYQHILITTDGSELAEHGVTTGLALAKSLGAKVSFIVVEEPFDWHRFSDMTGQLPEDLQKYVEQHKMHPKSVLDRVANEASRAGVSCETIHAESGHPHQAIIAAAEDKGCDLIVMSSHGRSGLAGLLIGSVTHKVLTHTKIPVLVCR
jgi:nucleotide-binding universal stress UspA family protein